MFMFRFLNSTLKENVLYIKRHGQESKDKPQNNLKILLRVVPRICEELITHQKKKVKKKKNLLKSFDQRQYQNNQ